MKTLIKNGLIVDGTGSKPYHGDLLISDDLIVGVYSNRSLAGRVPVDSLIADKMSDTGLIDSLASDLSSIDEKSITNLAVDYVIDVKGAYVAPGFIDLHSHADLVFFLEEGLKPKIMQGITTEVVGQCGLGIAPIPRDKQMGWRKNLVIGNPPINWNWETMGEYLSALQNHGLEANVVPFVGHGVLRYALKKDESTPMNHDQLKKLYNLVVQAFADGAAGLSLGLIYFPAVFADQNELSVLMKAASDYDKLVAVHLRNESNELIEAMQEMIDLSVIHDSKLHISHLKSIGPANWDKIDDAIALVEKYNLTFDHYPYIAGSTSLLTILPPFLLEDGIEEALQKLKKPEIREQIARICTGKESLRQGQSWDNISFLLGWDKIEIADLNGEKNAALIGFALEEIAKMKGKTPFDTALDLLIEEKGNIRMIDYYLSEEIIIKLLSHPAGMIGSDCLFGGKLHPRVFGTFPKIINQYVFKKQIIPIETAIAKMTSHSAKLLGLKDRGIIAEGFKADIVIFDQNFSDCATYQDPENYPQGLKYLLINGQFKVFNGQYQKIQPGVILQ